MSITRRPATPVGSVTDEPPQVTGTRGHRDKMTGSGGKQVGQSWPRPSSWPPWPRWPPLSLLRPSPCRLVPLSYPDRVAPVQDDRLPGQVGGVVGDEEGGGRGRFLGAA